jgi:hypothetical protein
MASGGNAITMRLMPRSGITSSLVANDRRDWQMLHHSLEWLIRREMVSEVDQRISLTALAST